MLFNHFNLPNNNSLLYIFGFTVNILITVLLEGLRNTICISVFTGTCWSFSLCRFKNKLCYIRCTSRKLKLIIYQNYIPLERRKYIRCGYSMFKKTMNPICYNYSYIIYLQNTQWGFYKICSLRIRGDFRNYNKWVVLDLSWWKSDCLVYILYDLLRSAKINPHKVSA